MGRVELQLLGTVGLSQGGSAAPLAPAQRRLLAVLLTHRRHVVSVDALSEALWGDTPPPTARATLQTHLSKLRRTMEDDDGEILVNRPPGYVLEVPTDAVDADRFSCAVDSARAVLADAPADALQMLDDCLRIWCGRALAEFADEPWARPEAVRLEELRLAAFELRNDARLASGDPGAAVGEIEALAQEFPFRERFWEQLMVALHRSGRQAEALRAGQTLRLHLRDELGLEPSPTFRALESSIAIDHETPTSPGADALRHAGPGAPIGAPGLATELIGRATDLEHLADAVGRSRLVTLTGPGGVGKSTLAAELARRLADRFEDGVRFVELATVQDERALVAAVAHALDVERRSTRSLEESIVEVLGPRELLLVLDNCEHVIATVGDLATRIVRWCPRVRLVATSREPIGVSGETVRPVAPLEVPSHTTDPLEVLLTTPAVQVFVARAEESVPSFEITERSAPAVAELCIQLDGLPLALELAAVRMASMSPRQLADRIHERFALLRSGAGRDARHRTLSDLVQWSYELLNDKEQLLLARLSVFAGGFDLEAAEQVCGVGELAPVEVAHLLAVLVDKSMVVASHTADGVRYRQLETLRRFGADRLVTQAEAERVRAAHLQTFVELVELGAVALDTAAEAASADRLERDLGNLRVAMRTALENEDPDSALRLVDGTRELAFRRIRYEVVEWADAAASLEGAEGHPLFPTVLGVVAYGRFVRGELDGAIELAERAVDARDRLGLAPCGLPERVLGNALFYRGDHDAALDWMDQMLAAAEHSAVDGRIAHALYMRSVAHTSLGDPVAGTSYAAEADAAAQRSASPTAMAQAAYATGLAMATVDPDAAIECLDRSAELAGSVGNRWMRAFAMTEAMWLRAGRGETVEALRGYRHVVETWFQGGDWANQWLSLRHLAGILARLDRDEEAAVLFGSVAAAGASTALPISPSGADELGDVAGALAQRLGPVAAAEANRRGAMMRDDATVAAALHTISELVGRGVP